MVGLTYWNPIAKKNVDVTDETPLPVGGGVLGQLWDGDPTQVYSPEGTVNSRLGQIAVLLGQMFYAVNNDNAAQAGVVVYPRGLTTYAGQRTVDGAFTDGGGGLAFGGVASDWAIQVEGKLANGTPQAATAWDVRLELSLNGGLYTEVAAHATGDGNGAVKFVTGKPAPYVRFRVNALTLGSANKLEIAIAARP